MLHQSPYGKLMHAVFLLACFVFFIWIDIYTCTFSHWGTSKNSKRINKLDFGEPQASGILSPAYWRGGKFNSPGRKPWGKVKIVTEPRAERVGGRYGCALICK